MSVVDERGLKAELPQRSEDRAEFLQDLLCRWHQRQPYRMRCLAALQLIQFGWSYEEVRQILRLSSKGRVHDMVRKALDGLQAAAVPPTERDARANSTAA